METIKRQTRAAYVICYMLLPMPLPLSNYSLTLRRTGRTDGVLMCFVRQWQECEREDRKMCLMSSIMHTLCAISRASPVCRKAALFAVLQKQKQHDFCGSFIQKVRHLCVALLAFSAVFQARRGKLKRGEGIYF